MPGCEISIVDILGRTSVTETGTGKLTGICESFTSRYLFRKDSVGKRQLSYESGERISLLFRKLKMYHFSEV